MWYKRTLPLILVFIMGLIGFVQDYVAHPASGEVLEVVTTWFRIIGGFALFIGVYSLIHMHVSRIRRKPAGWGYSLFVFLGAALMIVSGLYNGGYGPLAAAPGEDTWFQWMYNYIQVPCGATIFSILAFFMASAAYRTFRARNLDAIMLLVAAVIVMFGRVPISDLISSHFSQFSDFLMAYPNLAAKRGILLGISLGAIAQSLRILFGIERSYMGAGD
jgi:hypothetical protein